MSKRMNHDAAFKARVASGDTVDDMDLQALEALMQKAKATSLSIQALAGRLEAPA